jgi:hypothetical protein
MWVDNGFNLYVWAWDCGAGRFYVVLLRLHLAFIIFPFPVSTAQLIGEFSKTRQSATSDVALHLLRRYMTPIWSLYMTLAVLKGEAGRLPRANRRSAANS